MHACPIRFRTPGTSIVLISLADIVHVVGQVSSSQRFEDPFDNALSYKAFIANIGPLYCHILSFLPPLLRLLPCFAISIDGVARTQCASDPNYLLSQRGTIH
ncbi:hypothetical protein B0H34DRAFT_728707 [Crassisporium funariophilum]|nr:hypothetical protein B0H34DRAFT_728707 [Crassisporium funariophilum]